MSARARPTHVSMFVPLSLAGLTLVLVLLWNHRPAAEAQESGPIFAQAMRQSNGLMVLVSAQPALPSFTATVHYQIGQAHEWHTLFGATELIGELLLDGTSQVGSRNPAVEGLLLGQLDQLDARLRRARQVLRVADPYNTRALEAEIGTLDEQIRSLSQQLSANSFLRITEQLYRERGAVGPLIRVTPSEVQLTVTMPSDQLSFFLGLERMRLSSFSSRNFYAARAALAERRRLELKRSSALLLRDLLATVFEQHPFGRYLPDGTSIEGISRDELENFHRVYFRPSQTVISIVGGVRPDELRVLAARYLGDLPRGLEPELLEVTEPPQRGARRVEVEGNGPAEVTLAFPRAGAELDGRSPMLPLLVELLGDSNAGLFAPLVSSGLVSSLSASLYPAAPPLGALYPDALLVSFTGNEGVTAEQLEARVLERLHAQLSLALDPMLIEGARRRARGRLAQAFADPTSLAPMMARSAASYGDPEVLNQLYREVGKVGTAEVQQVAARLFVASQMSTGLRHAPPPPPVLEAGHDQDHEAADSHAEVSMPAQGQRDAHSSGSAPLAPASAENAPQAAEVPVDAVPETSSRPSEGEHGGAAGPASSAAEHAPAEHAPAEHAPAEHGAGEAGGGH